MTQRSLLELVDRLRGVETAGDARDALSHWLEPFGITAFLVTGLPAPQHRFFLRAILLDGWPPDWRHHYVREELYRADPCARRCRAVTDAFFWSDILGAATTPGELRVMEAAAAFGLREGVCVPLHGGYGLRAAATFAGARLDRTTDLRQHLALAASHVLQVAARLRWPTGAAAALTPRQAEIVSWCARGKTVQEIADITGCSNLTVETHLRDARARLEAANTTELAVQALVRGEIVL